MKLLFILHNHSIEGSLISFMKLGEGLMNKGVNLYLTVTPQLSKNSIFTKWVKQYGIVTYVVPVIPSAFYSENLVNKSWLKVLRIKCGLIRRKIYSLYRVIKVIRKVSPDIVHTNTGVIHEGFWASFLLRKHHVWHLREYQDLDFHLAPIQGMNAYKKLLRKSYVISITNDILSHFDLENSIKSSVIYNGICNKDDVVYLPNKEDYFLCASRVSVEKCHDEVVRAFSKFVKHFPEYKLLIAGEAVPDYLKYLQNLIDECGCRDSVVFLGHCENVKELMIKAKALIVASRNEGLGRMTIEAAFYGCLAIGRNTGGTKEVLDIIGGYPYGGGVDALCESMCSVVSLSEDSYKEKAMNAQSEVLRLFSVEQNIENVYKLYQTILN